MCRVTVSPSVISRAGARNPRTCPTRSAKTSGGRKLRLMRKPSESSCPRSSAEISRASRRRRASASRQAAETRKACNPCSLSQRLPMTGLRAKNFSWVKTWASHNGINRILRSSESIALFGPPNPTAFSMARRNHFPRRRPGLDRRKTRSGAVRPRPSPTPPKRRIPNTRLIKGASATLIVRPES